MGPGAGVGGTELRDGCTTQTLLKPTKLYTKMGVFMLCEFHPNLKGKKGNLAMFPLLPVLESEEGYWQVPRLVENSLPWEEQDRTELYFSSSQHRSLAGWETPAQIECVWQPHHTHKMWFNFRPKRRARLPQGRKPRHSQKHNTH